MTVDQSLHRHADLWTRAVRHRFLDAVRDGSLSDAAFDTWLTQDHHFVEDLLWFQARLLARAPAPARRVLADGVLALVDELAWFEKVSRQRRLALGGDRLPAAQHAGELLRRLDDSPVPTALLGLWAIERAYLDAWSYAAPGAPDLRPYVEHWTTPEFEAYVDALGRLSDASPPDTDEIVADVAVMERTFWDMAWTEGARS
jgi:thiaminase/transcriptional activator TenA